MTSAELAALHQGAVLYDAMTAAVGARPLEIIGRRVRTAVIRGRGWLVRRMLLAADVLGLAGAFLAAQLLLGQGSAQGIALETEYLLFLATLPGWVVLAK